MARAKRSPPPLVTEEPEHRPLHAMRADWVDPDDMRPNARQSRKIHGWRTYDPLRRMSGHPSSGITTQHIMAADLLRERVDLAVLGYSTERPLIYVAQFPLPRWGLGPAAVAQLAAMRDVRRLIALFSLPQLQMIDAVLLKNVSVRQWTLLTTPPLQQAAEKRKLLVILDRLVEYYANELKTDIARGRRLAP